MVAVDTHLHACVIDIEGEVAVADLQWRGVVIDQSCADNIELGHNALSKLDMSAGRWSNNQLSEIDKPVDASQRDHR